MHHNPQDRTLHILSTVNVWNEYHLSVQDLLYSKALSRNTNITIHKITVLLYGCEHLCLTLKHEYRLNERDFRRVKSTGMSRWVARQSMNSLPRTAWLWIRRHYNSLKCQKLHVQQPGTTSSDDLNHQQHDCKNLSLIGRFQTLR